MIKTLRNFSSWQHIATVGCYGLFWSWNLIFLAFMIFGFAPTILVGLITAVRAGIVPWKFLLVSVGIIAIPAVAVVLGATILRKYPKRLLALGYGVEGPLMLLLILRFFGLQELNPAMVTLYTIAFLGLAAFFWQVMKVDAEENVVPSQLRVIGVTLMLGLGLYASVIMAFYVLPLGIALVQAIPDLAISIGRELRALDFREFTFMLIISFIFLLFGGLLWLYTATILVGMPIVVPILYWKGWRRAVDALSSKWSGAMTGVLVAATVAVCAVALFATMRQPQVEAFSLLKTPPASVAEAEALLAKTETIRQGLTNSYLASFRYASVHGGVDHVSEMYMWALEISEERAASVQRAYEWLAQPMLYTPADPEALDTIEVRESDGRLSDPIIFQEAAKAAELYERFFDEPINQGERAAVVAAARSTWEVDRAEKAWQAVDNREVYLTRQEITIEEHGDWAELELYEVYQNQTAQQQEVVYYFSVPESAVMTGVWLGNSADRDKRFVYTVATRGAAQEVYRQELVQRRDPALLEQIGPRQYRLRIFPIPERRVNWSTRSMEDEIIEGKPLHMWLTWRVLAQDGRWALPMLAERRNIYWNDESIRLLNEEAFQADDDTWMPNFAPVIDRMDPMTHRVDYAADKTVVARPLSADQTPQLSEQSRLALVVDQSYSMQKQADAVTAAVMSLAATHPNADLYLTASQFRGEPATRLPLSEFDLADLFYMGGQNAAELLSQFDAQRGQDIYDAVLVLTDGTGYELGEGDVATPTSNEPIWMVHLGGFPLGYDDNTLEAIQASGGGVAATVDEALMRLAISQEQIDGDAETRDLIDGYIWETFATAVADEVLPESDDGFAPIGGRRLILAEMQKVRHQLDDVTILDELHAIAVENSIVTPYSSMIVLVNEQQRRLLENLENQADRFEREHEDVGNTMPPPPQITGVPEPEEWLLILIALAMLGWYAHSNRLYLRKLPSK